MQYQGVIEKAIGYDGNGEPFEYDQCQIYRNGQPVEHIVRHSPTGLQWGYGGSGPADTALSILVDFFTRRGDATPLPRALRLYQVFKMAYVAGFGREWSLDDETIAAWVLEAERGAKYG